MRCSALRETAVVYPEGTVGICELRSESPGNLRDYDMNLKLLWRSTKAKSLRRARKDERCFCWHQCFLSASIIKTPKMWLKLLKLTFG